MDVRKRDFFSRHVERNNTTTFARLILGKTFTRLPLSAPRYVAIIGMYDIHTPHIIRILVFKMSSSRPFRRPWQMPARIPYKTTKPSLMKVEVRAS